MQTYMPQPATPRRLTLIRAGEVLDAAMRVGTERLLASLPQLPEPRMVASDLRRRPIGFRSLGQVLFAAARDRAPLERALAIPEALHSFVMQLYPTDIAPTLEVWQCETREQGEADVAQGTGLLTRTIGDLDRAIEETLEEIGAKRRLLYRLQLERANAGRAT